MCFCMVGFDLGVHNQQVLEGTICWGWRPALLHAQLTCNPRNHLPSQVKVSHEEPNSPTALSGWAIADYLRLSLLRIFSATHHVLAWQGIWLLGTLLSCFSCGSSKGSLWIPYAMGCYTSCQQILGVQDSISCIHHNGTSCDKVHPFPICHSYQEYPPNPAFVWAILAQGWHRWDFLLTGQIPHSAFPFLKVKITDRPLGAHTRGRGWRD